MNDAVARGQKLLHLYRRGVGGERRNAGRLLTAHLRTHDLTLYDLDQGLPVSQNITVLDDWRESAQWMARLGTEPEAVLTALVDAEDLTPTELGRLIASVDLDKLLGARLDGWAYAEGTPPDTYRQAAAQVKPADLTGPELSGSLTRRFQAATRLVLFRQTHPERTVRTQDSTEQAFVLGLVEALTGRNGEPTEGGVRARLGADQLARLRALLAEHGDDAREVARKAARAYGKNLQ